MEIFGLHRLDRRSDRLTINLMAIVLPVLSSIITARVGFLRHTPFALHVLCIIFVAMVGGFVWGGLHALWHLRDSFVATAGAPSQPWYERLDHFNILLSSEIFFLASAAITIYLKSWNRGRRLKVRPERPALW